MWAVFALLSALFAAFTSIFAKIGIENINSNLATAIRTVVILVITWGTVFVTGSYADIPDINKKAGFFLLYREYQPACHGCFITRLCRRAMCRKPRRWINSV